jgi:hypothetical protein
MQLRSWMLPLLGAALLGASSTVACAMPSLAGPTGIVTTPTAKVAPTTEWQTAVSYHSLEVVGMYDASLWSLQILKGVADDAEMWAKYLRSTNGEDTDVWEIGGKYQLSERLFERRGFLTDTDVAVGASLGRWVDAFAMYEMTGDWTADVDTFKLYAVVTKQVYPLGMAADWEWATPSGTIAIASGGLLYQSFDPDVGGSETSLRPFLGLEIIGSNKLTVAFEYRAKDTDVDEKAIWSALLRRQFGPRTAVELGTTNASPIGTGREDQEFFLRFGYDLPLTEMF